MTENRSMDQAIRDEVDDLERRHITEEKAMQLYWNCDRQYRETISHKTQTGSTYLYIRREGIALYLKEKYGVDLK